MFDFMRRLMYGRYGNDSLNQFLMIAGLFLAALWSFVRIDGLAIGIVVLLFLCYFRMFSRNIAQRQKENQKFLSLWLPAKKRSKGLGCGSKTAKPIGISNANAAKPTCAYRGERGKLTLNVLNVEINL